MEVDWTIALLELKTTGPSVVRDKSILNFESSKGLGRFVDYGQGHAVKRKFRLFRNLLQGIKQILIMAYK